MGDQMSGDCGGGSLCMGSFGGSLVCFTLSFADLVVEGGSGRGQVPAVIVRTDISNVYFAI